MRKFTFLIVLLSISIAGLGQCRANIVESFDGWSDGSYGGISSVTLNGYQWETNNSMCHSQNARSGNAIRFNDDSGANEYLLFKGADGNGKDGGLGVVSFWFRHWVGDGSSVQFQVQYNQSGGGWINVGSVIDVTSTTYAEYSQSVDIAGNDILIQVISISDAERLLIDDFSMTDYAGGGNQPPVITGISNNPLVPTSSETVSVSADVTDTDGTVGAVACYYGTVSGNLTSNIGMSLGSGSTYTTDSNIPAYADGVTVYYEIYALDDEADETTSPEQNYFVTDPVTQPNAWINEFHYDNDGGDVGEFVEIVIDGTYTLSDFQVDLYNGGNKLSYDEETANNFTVGTTEGNFKTYYWSVVLQNGGPDGLALSYQGVLIPGQFLSYEGSFTAADGPAIGVTSTDIGVSENSSTPIGYSLQLKGGGDEYALFNWVDPAPETPGEINNGQYFISNSTNWTGSSDNVWTDPTNWNNGVPDVFLTAVIPSGITNYPTLSASGICDDLIMESNASLVGVDKLTVNGTAIIERTVNGYTTDYDGYHFLSAPVSSFTIAGSDFEPTPGTDDFFAWDEPTNYWLNFEDGLTDTDFVVGKGYLVAYDPTNPGTFTGNLNNSSTTKNLTYTSGFGEGWNLLGNPFTSAIDWNSLTKTAGVYGSYYILNGTDNTYLSSNGSGGDFPDGHIPINNGFFVKTDATPTQSVTIAPSAQVHGSLGFLKSGNEFVSENTLKISIANETYQNATYIQFRSDASVEFDNAIDAYKLFGTSDAPQLFTSLTDIEYSINCLPFSSDINQLPMGFKNRLASEYTISASGIESFVDEQVAFYLEDTETNDLIDLSVESYTFLAQNVNYDDRFILHFSGITSIEEEMLDNEVQIYANGNSVYFRFDQLPKGKSIVSVFNTLGQQVYGGEIEHSNLSAIKLNNKPGIYVIRLQTSQGITTQKVLIN